MADLERLSPIRELFHTFISKVTSLQTVAYFFAYQLKEVLRNGKVSQHVNKDIKTTLDKIENYSVLARGIMKEIKGEIAKMSISDRCKPFIDSIEEAINNISTQIKCIKDTYDKTQDFEHKANIEAIVDEFEKIDPYCLTIASIYRDMKDKSVLEK
ncbi:MAG: hypothetical protein ISS92_03540 [Candidatus Omnitrophica bacterium]|nr:hypothetical protein [Candidatus Omnitrophota bacterium]